MLKTCQFFELVWCKIEFGSRITGIVDTSVTESQVRLLVGDIVSEPGFAIG